MFKGIDLYSDTLTQPSIGMRKAIAEALVGDEQKGEDPTTLKLEERMSTLLGHESAYFFPSATMANEVALRLLGSPGDEILAYENCHLYFAEAGGPAVHAGLMTRSLPTPDGVFNSAQVEQAFCKAKGPHYPRSSILAVENTTNMGGGVAWTEAGLKSVTTTARELGMKPHLDGARLWNAATKEGYSLATIGQLFETVTVCFSKGMGCPTGAVLAFPARYRSEVRRLKQLFGGSMRQSGMLAAACLYALDHCFERLTVDHENAALLADSLNGLPGLLVENPVPSTNMVFFRWQITKMSASHFLEICEKKGVRFSLVGPDRFRAVTHLNVSRSDIELAARTLTEIIKGL